MTESDTWHMRYIPPNSSQHHIKKRKNGHFLWNNLAQTHGVLYKGLLGQTPTLVPLQRTPVLVLVPAKPVRQAPVATSFLRMLLLHRTFHQVLLVLPLLVPPPPVKVSPPSGYLALPLLLEAVCLALMHLPVLHARGSQGGVGEFSRLINFVLLTIRSGGLSTPMPVTC